VCGLRLLPGAIRKERELSLVAVHVALLIVSRPVVLWNLIAVLTNAFSEGAYLHYARRERRNAPATIQ